MRKLSLRTYNVYELKKIDIDHTLKIMNMLEDVEGRNPRLLAPLATFLYLGNYKEMPVGPRLEKVVQDMFKKYPVVSEANALKYLKNCEDDEISRYYYAYVSENMRRDQNELKNKLRDDIKIYQKRKNLSNYKICKLTNTDPGNFHSFYELNRNDKLSVKKLRAILNTCIKL